MRLLNQYIRLSVISATLLVVVVIIGVQCFMEFFNLRWEFSQAHIGLVNALEYVFMQLPSDLYQLFPMAGFLGCLLGLGHLASSNQLIVMRASGVSIGRIVWSVVKAALLLMILMTLLGEIAAPRLQIAAHQLKDRILHKGFQGGSGVWLREGASFIHIGSVTSDHEIRDVTRFMINPQHKLLSADYAPRGELINGRWILDNVQMSQLSPNHITKRFISRLPLNFSFDPILAQTGQTRIAEQSILSLYQSIRDRQAVGLETSQYAFAFWTRIIQPFATIVTICLGVPFIFGSLRTSSMGFRLLMGVSIGFIFYMLNQFFGPFAMVYQIPPWAAAVMPTVLCALLCLFLFRRSWV